MPDYYHYMLVCVDDEKYKKGECVPIYDHDDSPCTSSFLCLKKGSYLVPHTRVDRTYWQDVIGTSWLPPHDFIYVMDSRGTSRSLRDCESLRRAFKLRWEFHEGQLRLYLECSSSVSRQPDFAA